MKVFQVIGRVFLSPVRFLREVVRELALVTWPTPQQTVKATMLVVLSSLAIGAYIALLDFGFAKGVAYLLTFAK